MAYPTVQTKSIGTAYEDLAVAYLQQQNLHILQRNFRCKLGEIDVIAKDKDALIFAEVRYRKNSAYGGAAASVTTTKQRKIIRTAQFFLQSKTWAQQINCRFDVIAITQSTQSPTIEWIKDAFNA